MKTGPYETLDGAELSPTTLQASIRATLFRTVEMEKLLAAFPGFTAAQLNAIHAFIDEAAATLGMTTYGFCLEAAEGIAVPTSY